MLIELNCLLILISSHLVNPYNFYFILEQVKRGIDRALHT